MSCCAQSQHPENVRAAHPCTACLLQAGRHGISDSIFWFFSLVDACAPLALHPFRGRKQSCWRSELYHQYSLPPFRGRVCRLQSGTIFPPPVGGGSGWGSTDYEQNLRNQVLAAWFCLDSIRSFLKRYKQMYLQTPAHKARSHHG